METFRFFIHPKSKYFKFSLWFGWKGSHYSFGWFTWTVLWLYEFNGKWKIEFYPEHFLRCI